MNTSFQYLSTPCCNAVIACNIGSPGMLFRSPLCINLVYFCPLLYQSSCVLRICMTRTIPAKPGMAKTHSVTPSYAIKAKYSGHTTASTLNIILLQNGVVLSLSCLEQFMWTKLNLPNWDSLKDAAWNLFGKSHFWIRFNCFI